MLRVIPSEARDPLRKHEGDPSPASRLGMTLALLAFSCATGLHVVRDIATYERLVGDQPEKRLVDIEQAIPGVAIDVRYATSNNFMHTPLYPIAKVFLRAPAAEALREVQNDLAKEGLGLKIFDGYRPYSVTVRMWEPIRNPDYVADPAKGSRHNRGAAVDLTLIDLRTKEELPMPTPYDDFTPRARQDYSELPPEVVANRARLRKAMVRHGFEPLPSEWWHFDFHDWQKFELMDIPLPDANEAVPADTIMSLERAWSTAFLRHDTEAIAEILADEFVGIDGRGFVSDKAAELREAKAPEPGAAPPAFEIIAESYSDMRVRVFGTTAVLTDVNTVTARFNGKDAVPRYRRTTVWVKRDGRWQCVSFHASRILEP